MNRLIRRLPSLRTILRNRSNTVIWRRVESDQEFCYEAVIDGQKAKLIVNDFPDEALFTVITADHCVVEKSGDFVPGQRHDYNYLPRNWQLDHPLRTKVPVKAPLPDDPMFWNFLPPDWKAPKDWDK